MSDGILDRISNGIDVLGRVAGWIAATAVFGILALVGLEIVLRAVFQTSTQVSDEMSGYLNVAVIYFGLAMALREGTFVRVEPIYNRLKDRFGRAVQWFIVLVSLGYMLVATWVVIRYVSYSYRAGLVSTNYSETPLWIPQTFIIVGSVFLVLQLCGFLLRGCRNVP